MYSFLCTIQSSEENRRLDLVNTLKPQSEEILFKRKQKPSQSTPAIPATTKKLRSSSEMQVQRKFTSGSRKQRRSSSIPAYIKMHTIDDKLESAETDQVDKDKEASKRFSELAFLIKKIYDVSVCIFTINLVVYKIHISLTICEFLIYTFSNQRLQIFFKNSRKFEKH